MGCNYLPLAAVAVTILLANLCQAERYALLVGVDRCDDYVVPGNIPPEVLTGAEANARDFGKMLEVRYGFNPKNVYTLLGDNAPDEANNIGPATYDNIRNTFESLKHKIGRKGIAGSEHRFVFYFAGHGTQVPDSGVRDEDKQDGLDEALCPFDAVCHNGVPDRLIVDDELNHWLQDIPVREITVVLDCCHAGTAAKGEQGGPDRIVERSAPGVRQNNSALPWKDFGQQRTGPRKTIIALYACGAGQPAIERFFPELDQSRGQFTQLLIEHLADPKSSDTLADLSLATKQAIDAWANGDPRRAAAGQQTPTFEPAGEKDRALILR
jgi:hypothetical protein